jgi:hypothetical protein
MSVTYKVRQKAKNRYYINALYFVGVGSFVKEKNMRYDTMWFNDGWFMIV